MPYSDKELLKKFRWLFDYHMSNLSAMASNITLEDFNAYLRQIHNYVKNIEFLEGKVTK